MNYFFGASAGLTGAFATSAGLTAGAAAAATSGALNSPGSTQSGVETTLSFTAYVLATLFCALQSKNAAFLSPCAALAS